MAQENGITIGSDVAPDTAKEAERLTEIYQQFFTPITPSHQTGNFEKVSIYDYSKDTYLSDSTVMVKNAELA